MEFLDRVYYSNSVKAWIIAVVTAIAVYIVLKIVKSFIHRRVKKFAERTTTELDDLIAELLNKIKFFFLFFISVYFGTLILQLPQTLKGISEKLVIIAILVQGAIWGTGLITYWINNYKKRRFEQDAASVTTFSALGFVVKLALWSVILILVLDNLGVDITALVAGLGVGGIAVALAVQNVLGDLFASLSIVLDKPFVIGDFIIVDSYLGSIEHIGLKTTRIRSLSGEQLVFSNTDLLRSRIRNYKRMYERRVVFGLGVTYQTPADKLERIPLIIREIVESQEPVRFDRAHFKEYGDFSLNFEVVYWVRSPDYNKYMDIQQSINLQIYRKFEKENIEFAYPTQTLFMEKEQNDSELKSDLKG